MNKRFSLLLPYDFIKRVPGATIILESVNIDPGAPDFQTGDFFTAFNKFLN